MSKIDTIQVNGTDYELQGGKVYTLSSVTTAVMGAINSGTIPASYSGTITSEEVDIIKNMTPFDAIFIPDGENGAGLYLRKALISTQTDGSGTYLGNDYWFNNTNLTEGNMLVSYGFNVDTVNLTINAYYSIFAGMEI